MQGRACYSRQELLQFPISSLAYVGDAVYELAVRAKLLAEQQAPSGKLFQASLAYVKASAQAERLEQLLPHLRPEELDLVKRARNHRSVSKAKHADVSDYRMATALEALVGWLWLLGEEQRLEALLHGVLEEADEQA